MKISASRILPAALVVLVGGGIVTSGLLSGAAPVSAYSGVDMAIRVTALVQGLVTAQTIRPVMALVPAQLLRR